MENRKVLGRGLEALIPQAPVDSSKEKVQSLKVEQIQASRFQPRLTFSQEKIHSLLRINDPSVHAKD